LLDMPAKALEYELSIQWISSKLYEVGFPMMLGAVLFGAFLSATGYFLIKEVWRRSVLRKWRIRQASRRQSASEKQ